MARGFRWQLCNYVGGDYAVKPSAKPYLVLDPIAWEDEGQWAGGILTVGARSFVPITVGTGFRPTMITLVSFRPRNHNGTADTDFGNRGGGMTFGVAGHAIGGADFFDSGETYDIGDRVKHGGVLYESTANGNTDTPPGPDWDIVQPDTWFTGSTRIQQGFDLGTGFCTWREDCVFNVVSGRDDSGGPVDILTLSVQSFDSGGFTLGVDENLYDQNDPIFWFACSGNVSVHCFDAGDTSIDGYHGTPGAAMFLSTKNKLVEDPDIFGRFPDKPDYAKTFYWDHMEGFASPEGGFSRWGGGKPTSWNWTTEHWRDDSAITLGESASSSSFVGAQILARAFVSSFRSNGIDLQWPVFNNVPYRVGCILFEDGEAGWIEATFLKRPEVVGSNFQPTRLRPHVIFMTTTNYFFNFGDPNPLNNPHAPNEFGFGGGGGFGWHIYPFEGTAWGVHTYGNAVAEMGHYSNSGTQVQIGCIMAGAGSSSNPPAAHQHGIVIIPNPKIVGINYRYGERHSHVKRFHRNPSDVYVPEPP